MRLDAAPSSFCRDSFADALTRDEILRMVFMVYILSKEKCVPWAASIIPYNVNKG
jgi:hypothetical protein